MQREPVNSSNVVEVGYDPDSSTMEVLFRNGSLYQYFDIPQHEYDALRNAGSFGAYMNQNIKGRYRYARV
jgi:hypothetical protein